MPFLALFPMIFVGIVALALGDRSKRIDGWKIAAQRLGFTFEGGGMMSRPVMRGQIRGVGVVVTTVSRGSNDNNKTYTRYELSYPSIGPAVKLTRKGLGATFKKMLGFGGNDIRVGDPGFDDSVMVEGPNPDEIRRFLSPARKMAAMRVFNGFTNASVSHRAITAERHGMPKDPDEIVHTVSGLVDSAMVISAPTEVDLALRHQVEGDLGAATQALHEINQAQDDLGEPNAFTHLLEAEALIAQGEREAAARALDQIDVGTDDELDRWRQIAGDDPSPPTRPVREQPTDPTLSAPAVIDDLFRNDRAAYDTADHFEGTYHGRSVRWTGTVERSREFRFDSVFDGEGQRVIIEIGHLGEGRLTMNSVTAIVQIDRGVPIQADRQVTFTGTMVRVDHYMRNIYVANATLVE